MFGKTYRLTFMGVQPQSTISYCGKFDRNLKTSLIVEKFDRNLKTSLIVEKFDRNLKTSLIVEKFDRNLFLWGVWLQLTISY